MKPFRSTIATLLVVLLFNRCSSVPKLETEAPKALKEVYYQKWNSGLKNGGSGIDLFIRLQTNELALDVVYFRGQVSKFKNSLQDSTLFKAQFNSHKRTPISLKDASFKSFQIHDKDCIIRYSKQGDNKQHYYKIVNIKTKKTVNYPSSPSNN